MGLVLRAGPTDGQFVERILYLRLLSLCVYHMRISRSAPRPSGVAGIL